MNIEQRVEELKTRGKSCKTAREFTTLIASDKSLKDEITSVYFELFGKQLSGCSNCTTDAFMEIINLKNIKEMEEKIKWHLRAGALLHDVRNFDSSKQMSNKNISEELAVYHLATNPGCQIYFDKLPEDWEAKIEAFKATEAKAEKEKQEAAEVDEKLKADLQAAIEKEAAEAAETERKATEAKAEKEKSNMIISSSINTTDPTSFFVDAIDEQSASYIKKKPKK